jgi:hypothetical protein
MHIKLGQEFFVRVLYCRELKGMALLPIDPWKEQSFDNSLINLEPVASVAEPTPLNQPNFHHSKSTQDLAAIMPCTP